MKYKWSFYNIDEKIGDFHIIFNTKTSSIVKIPNNIITRMINFLSNEIELPVNDSDINLLIEQGFIVEINKNEYEVVKNRYLKNYYCKNRLNLTVLPAEYCNLTCPYCFIYNYGGKYLSPILENKIINFIKKRILEREADKPFFCRINWFGGEPLLGKDIILRVMKEVNSFVTSLNITSKALITINSGIVTNGVLLTSELFKKLIDVGINIFQITFDGGKEFHDKTRCDKKGIGSFEKIIKNLRSIKKTAVSQKFSFSIRINFMKDSLNSVYDLIDLIAEIIGDDSRFTIYCRPIYKFETARNTVDSIENNIFSKDDGLKIQQELSLYISKKINSSYSGIFLDTLIPKSRNSWCFEDNDYSYIVGADGDVYKCDTLIGDKKFAIGSLMNDDVKFFLTNNFWTKNIFELEEFKKCHKCKLLPICYGGCKRNKMEGNYTCFVTEEFVRDNIREYIKKGGEKNGITKKIN